MPANTPLARKILLLKGDMSYQALSDDIFARTGKKISNTALFHLVAGERKGWAGTIETLAEYAGKPVSWFYEEEGLAPIGERIRELREERNLPRKALAELLNVAEDVIGSYEEGNATPSEQERNTLAEFFHVPLAYLEGRSSVRLLHDGDPVPREWIEGVAFMRRASTKLTEEEKQNLLDLAEAFIRTVEQRKRKTEGLE